MHVREKISVEPQRWWRNLKIAVDKMGQDVYKCFLDTGRELITPSTVAGERVSEAERPETPKDPRYHR